MNRQGYEIVGLSIGPNDSSITTTDWSLPSIVVDVVNLSVLL